jgi:ABC-type polysaccharide/polyol phosphate transport system ATPase subunit
MIYLRSVSQSLPDERTGRRLVLQDVSAALPSAQRLVLLGSDVAALTEILALLAGNRRPDRGQLVAGRIRRSPVINTGGASGSTLVPQLSVLENIRVAARTHGVDEIALIALVESACRLGRMLKEQVRTFNWPTRRRLEATLIAALPFDCYFVDRLHELEGQFVWQLIHVAGRRGAGIIFTSNREKQTFAVAQQAIVVRNGSLRLQSHVRKAMTTHVH